MRKLVILLITIAANVCAWPGQALAISEGGAIFLLIRPGARACGMGSAFAAVADDASATYFNPAGLAYLKVGLPAISEADIKNWPRFLDSFRETDSLYLLTAGDVREPGEFLILVATSPMISRLDIGDWRAVTTALGDSARPDMKALRQALDPERVESLDKINAKAANADKIIAKQELSDDDKAGLITALNLLIGKPGLYQQPSYPGIALPAQAIDLLKRTIADTLSGANIADVWGLWNRLRKAPDPFSRHVYNQLSDKLKERGNRLKTGDPAVDGFKTALAGELNKLIKKSDLYKEERLKGISLSEATVKLGAQKLSGTDQIRFNRALLLEIFAPDLGLWFDSEKLPPEQTRIVNRRLLEAALGDAITDYQKRPIAATLNEYLMTKLSTELDQAAKSFDGVQAMNAADAGLLADGINRLIIAPEFYQEDRFKATAFTETARKMIEERLTSGLTVKLNRTLLEEAYPAVFRPVGDKLTAPLHLRAMLSPVSRDILTQYFQGKTVTKQVKKKLVEDINAALARRDFYAVSVFAQYQLSDDSQDLVNAGAASLSKDNVQKLNRRLLEAMYPVELAKMKTDVRYTTLMHSPWLSDIWKDVGDMYYEYIAYAQPVKDWGVFGGNVIFLSEGVNWHTGPNGEDLGVFSSFEFSPCLSYSNKIYENLAGGINLKLIHSHLAPFGPEGSQGTGIATTWAIDLGALYKGPVKGLSIGLNVQNLGPKLVYISAEQADPLSRNIRGGIAYRILDGRVAKLTAAFDLTKTVVIMNRSWRDELKEAVQHWGVEYWYMGPASLALRSGYVVDEVGHIKGPTFGAGVGYKFIEFDFSMEPGGDLQNYNRKFSLSANF
ncbi:MAG: PorV/PorQ family protein [Candidatus Edwardsbacteria bacterium]|nr:PorV/PorQ family protein [Candidatus Edwardsbacteria bacterium]